LELLDDDEHNCLDDGETGGECEFEVALEEPLFRPPEDAFSFLLVVVPIGVGFGHSNNV